MSPRQIETRAIAPALRATPKAAPHRRNRDDLRTLTVAQALDATTGDGLAPPLDRYENRHCSRRKRRAPPIERPGYGELNADMTRMPPMAAAASCSCSL